MTRYVLGRLLQAIPLLFVITLIAFAILHLAPGDPAALLYGTDISAEQLAQIRASWGLDEPISVQYVKWLGNLMRGDLGRSFVDGRPALLVIAERIPATLQLTLCGLTRVSATSAPSFPLSFIHCPTFGWHSCSSWC